MSIVRGFSKEEKLKWTSRLIVGSIKSMCLNERGKKETNGDMKGWAELETSKFIKGHEVFFVVTGQKSNVIVVDFDNEEDYRGLTMGVYPVFEADLYPTVRTKKGYHVYFEYTDTLLQPDKTKLNVDIQGNSKRVYFAGSKYKITDNDYFEYK